MDERGVEIGLRRAREQPIAGGISSERRDRLIVAQRDRGRTRWEGLNGVAENGEMSAELHRVRGIMIFRPAGFSILQHPQWGVLGLDRAPLQIVGGERTDAS